MASPPYTPQDDGFHFTQMSDRWWETETCWFSFHHPGRRLGGWIYVMVRPNIGTVAGGAWVWDDSAYLPWEVLYSANFTAMRLPRDQDLTDIRLPTGVTVRVLKPLTTYDVGYSDGDRLQVALEFDAIMAPQPLGSATSSYANLSHFDQFGQVTGHIVVNGERIEIDCISMRDRTWGPRPEHRPRRASYVTGIADSRDGFFVTTIHDGGHDLVTNGFLLRGGVVSEINGGRRVVTRDPERNWITQVSIEGRDEFGRPFRAAGTPVSRIIINRHTAIDCNSLIRWQLDDNQVGWGEDQDLWPVHEWSQAVRARIR
jgi:hypothetical protein